MEDGGETAIYVLPSEPGMPPRAVIGQVVAGGVAGPVATWSRDVGTWVIDGLPLPGELADTITAHARSLGVEDFM